MQSMASGVFRAEPAGFHARRKLCERPKFLLVSFFTAETVEFGKIVAVKWTGLQFTVRNGTAVYDTHVRGLLTDLIVMFREQMM